MIESPVTWIPKVRRSRKAFERRMCAGASCTNMFEPRWSWNIYCSIKCRDEDRKLFHPDNEDAPERLRLMLHKFIVCGKADHAFFRAAQSVVQGRFAVLGNKSAKRKIC